MKVTVTESILATPSAQDQISHIVQTTMRRVEPDCQEAVANLFGRLSELRSPEADITRYVGRLTNRSPLTGQTLH